MNPAEGFDEVGTPSLWPGDADGVSAIAPEGAQPQGMPPAQRRELGRLLHSLRALGHTVEVSPETGEWKVLLRGEAHG
jgi:hypothetical protein